MTKTNLKIDGYLNRLTQWQKETAHLRRIVLDCQLTEEMKWGKPSYAFQEHNIVLIQGFKDYCALLFFKGVLLKDPKSILIQQTEHVQAARQIRFTNSQEIIKLEPAIRAYIREAIEAEKAGLKVVLKPTSQFIIPEEFQKQLDKQPALKAAFAALTPGRQRGYLLHFAAAKQSKTRQSRIEKYIPAILDGKGLDD
jgi:uncharacterized protein YdeI (YjbR/CyaY-like superfamily)